MIFLFYFKSSLLVSLKFLSFARIFFITCLSKFYFSKAFNFNLNNINVFKISLFFQNRMYYFVSEIEFKVSSFDSKASFV
jgi:hypothetical protein